MLTELDDSLLHQTALPFSQVAHSDHRFFDRYWFGMVAPDGSVGMVIGMGRYSNMNVLDGFVCVQTADHKQFNTRFSRALRPALTETRIGPFAVEVVRPLESFRLRLDPGKYPLACDITWTGTLRPYLEEGTYSRHNGRLTTDSNRFDQVGTVDGSLEVEGKTYEASAWFAARDHSWGIRPGVGGFEPVTGEPLPDVGRLFLWFAFRVDEFGGHFLLSENEHGEVQTLCGAVLWPGEDGPVLRIIAVTHEIEFHDGTRAYRHARLTITTEDGEKWHVVAEPILSAWAYHGTGYGVGFKDGKGLGVWRGSYLEETDVFDLSHPEIVRNSAGDQITPGHREQPCRITVNGKSGYAHFPVISRGPHHRYGLGR